MSAKRSKAPAGDDELDDMFKDIEGGKAPKKPSAKPKSSAPSKARPSTDKPSQNPLADLENELANQPSRPQTPRAKDTTKSRPSEDKPSGPLRKSAESARSAQASFTPSATSSELQDAEKKGSVEQTETDPAAEGGGWWGGWFATASATANAAMKQAEHAYQEIQKNEEAKKWAEQVRGNVGALRGLGDDLRQRAMPTFANILQTLAPPISSHERLLIHITHDMVGYPALDPLIYGVFNRVMSQVEGGDLLVVQRGHESRASDSGSFGGLGGGSAGWRDGPWWRQIDANREIGSVKGLVEGTKLCRVSAESYANEYFSSRGGITEAQKRALEPVSEDNPVRTSDIFMAVQAIRVEADTALFTGSAVGEKEKETSAVKEEPEGDARICFAIYLIDPVHEITYSTMSQEIPAKWITWLDASTSPAPTPGTDEEEDSDEEDEEDESDEEEEDAKTQQASSTPRQETMSVPDEIREIVESGGVDPREWVAEWVEEALGLSVGVLAQRYVARRMGVGEGRLGKGKQAMESLVQEGGGEAARAGLI